VLVRSHDDDVRMSQFPDGAAHGNHTESWTAHHGQGATLAHADHDARTWSSEEIPGPLPLSAKVPWRPSALRQKLSGDLQPMGAEEVRGRPAFRFHLRVNAFEEDLWVDTETYDVLRLRIVPTEPDRSSLGERITTMDFDWFTRTPEALQPLAFTPPPGYRRVRPS